MPSDRASEDVQKDEAACLLTQLGPVVTMPKWHRLGGKTSGLLVLALVGLVALCWHKKAPETISSSRAFLQRSEERKDGEIFEKDGKIYKRDCRPISTYELLKVTHNNFGGAGPSKGKEGVFLQALRHMPDYLCPDGNCLQQVTIEMHAKSEYKFGKPAMNGISGEFGRLVLSTGTHVKVQIIFKDATTGEVLDVPALPLSIFDLDLNNDNSGREFVVAFGDHSAMLDPAALITRSHTKLHDFHVYKATLGSGIAPNPKVPDSLTPDQRKRSIAFNFNKPKDMQFEIGSGPGNGLRIFSFSFMNALSSCFDVFIKDVAPKVVTPKVVCTSNHAEGYTIEESNLEMEHFHVSATCAEGFEGAAQVLPCSANNGQYMPSGCNRMAVCTSNDAEGYQISEESLTMKEFRVSATCAEGFEGAAHVYPCRIHSGQYTVNGCHPIPIAVCVSNDAEGYQISEESLTMKDFRVSATCAEGFEGAARVYPCIVHNGQYAVNGCHPIPKVPSSSSKPVCASNDANGYRISENSLTKEEFDVSATCADGFEGTAQVVPCMTHNAQYVVKGCVAVHEGQASPLIVVTCVFLLLLCIICCCLLFSIGHGKWKHRRRIHDIFVPAEKTARQAYAKKAMAKAFERKHAYSYRCALELALDAGVAAADIPVVMQLTKSVSEFEQLEAEVVNVEVCFILDYTGSMKVQIEQTQECVLRIVQELKEFKLPPKLQVQEEVCSSPPPPVGRTINLTMSAVGYNDWDPETKRRGRPVISVFGGKDMLQDHSQSLNAASFNLGGQFTSSATDLKAWMKQDLGHGGKIPEELTGGMLAASNLPWKADCRLAVIITDAPCHGKEYHSVEEDSFVDQGTGLSCTGRPEEALKQLKAKDVEVSVFHTNQNVNKMLAAFKKVMDIHEAFVEPSKTSHEVVDMLKTRMGIKPLAFKLSTYGIDEHKEGTVPCAGQTVEMRRAEGMQHFTSNQDGMLWIGLPDMDIKETLPIQPTDGSSNCSPWAELNTQFEEGYTAINKM